MQLSIIVPIHNEILYISRSFESIILAGSEVESEFFFVDGQSNDGTYEWRTDGMTRRYVRNATWSVNRAGQADNMAEYGRHQQRRARAFIILCSTRHRNKCEKTRRSRCADDL